MTERRRNFGNLGDDVEEEEEAMVMEEKEEEEEEEEKNRSPLHTHKNKCIQQTDEELSCQFVSFDRRN